MKHELPQVKPKNAIKPRKPEARIEQYIHSRPTPISEQIRAIQIRIQQLRAQTIELLAQYR